MTICIDPPGQATLDAKISLRRLTPQREEWMDQPTLSARRYIDFADGFEGIP